MKFRPTTLRADSLFSLNGLISETHAGTPCLASSFARWATFLLCSLRPSREKSFGESHSLSSSPSSTARFWIFVWSARAIVVLPEHGRPVIQSTNAIGAYLARHQSYPLTCNLCEESSTFNVRTCANINNSITCILGYRREG